MSEETENKTPSPHLAVKPASDRLSRFAFIDSVRGLAILAVIVVHTGLQTPGLPGRVRELIASGQYGVQLFFVVSAFTLCFSAQSRNRVERRPTLYYFLRRFFRVAPLFWTAAFAYIALSPKLRTGTFFAPGGYSARDFVATLFFLHSWYPTSFNSVVPGGWSIGTEAMFYFSLPLLLQVIRTTRSAAWVLLASSLGTSAALPTIAHVLTKHFPTLDPNLISVFVLYSFPSQLPVFLSGILASFLVRDGIGVGIAASTTPLVFLLVLQGSGLFQTHVSAGITFSGLLVLASCASGRLLASPLLSSWGVISFSVYIWHFALLDRIDPWIAHLVSSARFNQAHAWLLVFPCMLIAVLTLSLAVGTLSYHLVERVGIQTGRRVIQWFDQEHARPRLRT